MVPACLPSPLGPAAAMAPGAGHGAPEGNHLELLYRRRLTGIDGPLLPWSFTSTLFFWFCFSSQILFFDAQNKSSNQLQAIREFQHTARGDVEESGAQHSSAARCHEMASVEHGQMSVIDISTTMKDFFEVQSALWVVEKGKKNILFTLLSTGCIHFPATFLHFWIQRVLIVLTVFTII